MADLTDGRSLPAIAEKPFRDRFSRIKQPTCKEKAVFYSGCLIDFAYPEMGEALIKMLNKAGIEVVFPLGQTCCGAPARYNGAYEVAEKNAIDNIQALLSVEATHVISACPTCTVALMHEFISTFESLGHAEWMPQARELAAKTVDFSTLIKRLVDEGRLSLKEGRSLGKLTYHDSCHLKRSLNVAEQPRALLGKAGYEVVEMFECDTCCGMGGSYSLKLPEISGPMLQRKLRNIKQTGAAVVAMDCPGCVLQIRGGMDQDGSAITVKHTLELLSEQIDN